MECNKRTEKKTERISKSQKEKLVEYMASNLEFARGQFSSINCNSSYKQQWESLKVSLNSLGGSEKTVEQWKKCWIDLKCGVKKAVSSRRKFINKTGGGSWADVPRDLNPMEEKILQVMTLDAVDGDGHTVESGVTIEEPFEDMLSVEVLDCEEMYMPPSKKIKTSDVNASPPSTSIQNKKKQSQATTSSSKFNEALDEARKMQDQLVSQLAKMEKKMDLILNKVTRIEQHLGIVP